MKKQGFSSIILTVITAVALIAGGFYLNKEKVSTGVASMRLPGSLDSEDVISVIDSESDAGQSKTATTSSVIQAVRESVKPKNDEKKIPDLPNNTNLVSKSSESSNISVSEITEQQILNTTKSFFVAISQRDGVTASIFISQKVSEFYSELLKDVLYTPKEKLLIKSPLTVISVAGLRVKANQDTVRLSGKELFASSISSGSSSAVINTFDPAFLKLISTQYSGNMIIGKFNYKEEPFASLKFVSENGIWKLDYLSFLFATDIKLESEVRLLADEYEISREKALESLVQSLYLHGSVTEYVLWTPLAVRSDLQATENIRMIEYSDSRYGFKIKYPEGWTIDSADNNGLYSIFFIAPAVSNTLRGSVVVNVMREPGKTLEQIVDEEISARQSLPESQWITTSSTLVTFQGYPAYELISTKLRTFDGGKTYVKQKTKTLLLLVGDLVYDFDYKHNVDDFDQFKSLGEKILSTVMIKEQ